ncbi:MAG TPA: amino acid permease [Rhodanobacteraceae bacterium]|nr:amino acid permease [Rhodanobacteraceae bacterium]
MGESTRDAGLVRAVGPWALAASIVNMVVGAGIFAVPASLAASVGPYAPLAFLVCAIAVGAIAICFAEGGSRVPTSGGAYGYIETAFGPLAGYVAGSMLWFSDLLACGGIAAALGDVASSLVAPEWRFATRTAVVVVSVGSIAFVNVCGVAHGARLVTVAALVKLVPLVLFVLAGAAFVDGANFSNTLPAANEDFGRALILALFTFTGMETALCASGEVREPARTIPRAIAIAMISLTVIYIGVQIVAQGVLGAALATSTAPLADAMTHVHPALRVVMLAGAAISMLGWLGSDILGTPRVLFAFARDGLMPRVLGRVHPSTRAPHVAILSYATCAIVLALTGTFAELAVLSTLLVTVPYVGGCAAAVALARRGVALAGAPLDFRWLSLAAVVGIASCVALIVLAARMEIAGLFATIAVAAAIYVVQTRATLARGTSA